jgi:peroxiredoxin
MRHLLTLALLACSLLAGAQNGGTGYQVGDIASDFKLKGIDNKTISLASYPNAKGYIVIFGCNTCPVSKGYEDRMLGLHKQYTNKGYPLIVINPNDPQAQPGESFEDMQAHAKQNKFSFPYLEDPGQTVTKQFGAQRTPHVFVLQKTPKGNVVSYIGAIDDDPDKANASRTSYVEKAVDALIDGRKPDVTFTKAVGCGVKWKKS